MSAISPNTTMISRSLTKIKIYYKNGGKRTFYSLETRAQAAIGNKTANLTKLIARFVDSPQAAGTYWNVDVYDNQSDEFMFGYDQQGLRYDTWQQRCNRIYRGRDLNASKAGSKP